MDIDISSMDVFHMGRLQAALDQEHRTRFLTTWSLKRKGPNPDMNRVNAWALHYLLQAYKMVPALQFGNLTYYHLCRLFDWWLCTKLRKEPDLLIILSGFGLEAMRKMHQSNVPVIVDSGSTHTEFQHRIVLEEYKRNGLDRPLFPECYRRRLCAEFEEADFIQVPTQFVKNTYLEAGIPEEKILMAAYGTDVSRFRPKAAEEMGPVFRVICPSGVNLRKGARILVEAWRKLNWSDAELHWVGGPGPETQHLFTEPLPGIVWHRWMPHEELAALYRSCDVLALPSFEEGFARVLIEGAASGLALIATPNTSVETFFSPMDPEGWLIPCNDIEALCNALTEAKRDRERTFQTGQRAAQRAEQGFTWEDYGRKVRENIRQVFSVR